ncbi:MAG TPA: cation-transporting P-type ATPase, partial [Saprospiraceae bacterium]|nr:cation-transporting P-type ATPase [Saprospiraceae bacterium]
MVHKIQLPKELVGLTDAQVIESRKIYGPNVPQKTNNYTGWKILLGLLKEPMLILLIGVSI